MKLFSSRIKNLQKQYKGDRKQLGLALIRLYRRERIHPTAGFLPILVLIPVFLALYWVISHLR